MLPLADQVTSGEATVNSTDDRVAVNSCLCGPLGRDLGDPIDGNQTIVASVLHLLFAGSPAAVVRLVTAIVVLTVKGKLVRWLTHVCEEIFEQGPSITNLNSSSAIILEGVVPRVAAALMHGEPSLVCSCTRSAVLETDRCISGEETGTRSLCTEAPTRLHSFVPKVGTSHLLSIPAITQAKPMRLAQASFNYRQTAKPLPTQFRVFWHTVSPYFPFVNTITYTPQGGIYHAGV